MSVHQRILQKARQGGAEEVKAEPVVGKQQLPTQDVKEEAIDTELDALNCSDFFISASSSVFPKTVAVAKANSLPIAAMIRPYAVEGEEIPESDYNIHRIIRCDKCKAFISPFSKFFDHGRRWRCNLCGNEEMVPQYYYSALDESGRRNDYEERAELHSPVYEFIAGREYKSREPSPPAYLFLIDVSATPSREHFLQIISMVLKDVVEGEKLPGFRRALIGVIAYDSDIHFVRFAKEKTPMIFTVPDTEEPFIPFQESILVHVDDIKTELLSFIDMIPSMFGRGEKGGSCLVTAIQIAFSVMKRVGGKVIVTCHSPEIAKDVDFHSYEATSGVFNDFTGNFQQNYVAVSLFALSSKFMNFITVAELIRSLGGDIHYHHMDEEDYWRKMYAAILTSLTKEWCLEAVFRIRISWGWKVVETLGNFSVKVNDLLSVSGTSHDKALYYEFKMEDEGIVDRFHIQTSLLYSDVKGERRIRVFNYSVKLTESPLEITRQLNSTVVSQLLLRKSLKSLYKDSGESTKGDVKKALGLAMKSTERIVAVSPRLFLEGGEPSTLILKVLAIMKSPHLNFKLSQRVIVDQKNALKIFFNGGNNEEVEPFFLPLLFEIGELSDTDFTHTEEGFCYKPSLNLSFDSLADSGLYLLYNGENIIIYIPNIETAARATAAQAYYEGDSESPGDEWLSRIDSLVNELRQFDSSLYSRQKATKYCSVLFATEGSNGQPELEFKAGLIESKIYKDSMIDFNSAYNMGYTDFLRILGVPL